MEIEGKLIRRFDEELITEAFKKREFVIETAENPQYPQQVKFELHQDKCALISPFKKGDKIKVTFNLKGRFLVNSKGDEIYFNTLQAWKIEREVGIVPQQQSPAPKAEFPATPEESVSPELANNMQDDEADDLPF